jgi:hypothetical protein
VRGEQLLKPVDEPRLLRDQRVPLALEMAPILVRLARHRDDVPDVALAFAVAHSHGDQLPGIEAVGLGAARAPIHFDGGGVDHHVGDPVR